VLTFSAAAGLEREIVTPIASAAMVVSNLIMIESPL
jgi:hypothetical protein